MSRDPLDQPAHSQQRAGREGAVHPSAQGKIGNHEARIRELERRLRRQSEPAQTSHIGEVETFKAQEAMSGSSAIPTTTLTGYINFQWGSGLGNYHSAGVSGLDTAANAVTLPAGGWIISAFIRFGGVPTSGYIYLDFYTYSTISGSPQGQIHYSDFGTAASATLNMTGHYVFESTTNLSLRFQNALNANLSVPGGYLMGTRFDPEAVTFGS